MQSFLYVTVRALRGVYAPLAFYYVNRFSMALLYGPAGRVTAKNGVFRPGQPGGELSGELCIVELQQLMEAERITDETKVRKTPSWPRSWANFSLL